MIAITKPFLVSFFFAASVALGACTSETSSSDAPKTLPEDTSPISPSNASGLWKLHYEWESAPPQAWTTFFGSATSGDLEVAVPNETQKRGMFAAPNNWGFAPMIATAEDGSMKWSFSISAGTKTISLDFAGTGTGSALAGDVTLSNDASVSATWRASKVRDVLVTTKTLSGDWTLDFQWARRTPGQLLVKCDAAGTCTIPAGQDGGPKVDDIGAVTLNGNQLALKFSGSTHVGVVTSGGVFWGYMDSTDGNTGIWTAKRGMPSVEETERHEGCTSNSDCGRCQRCELSTGKCLTRLTC